MGDDALPAGVLASVLTTYDQQNNLRNPSLHSSLMNSTSIEKNDAHKGSSLYHGEEFSAVTNSKSSRASRQRRLSAMLFWSARAHVQRLRQAPASAHGRGLSLRLDSATLQLIHPAQHQKHRNQMHRQQVPSIRPPPVRREAGQSPLRRTRCQVCVPIGGPGVSRSHLRRRHHGAGLRRPSKSGHGVVKLGTSSQVMCSMCSWMMDLFLGTVFLIVFFTCLT